MSDHTLEDTIQEMQAVNRVYYRMFMGRDDTPCVVCMQWFDELDYDKTRFINEKQYETEELAEQALLGLKLRAGTPLTELERLKLASRLLEE